MPPLLCAAMACTTHTYHSAKAQSPGFSWQGDGKYWRRAAVAWRAWFWQSRTIASFSNVTLPSTSAVVARRMATSIFFGALYQRYCSAPAHNRGGQSGLTYEHRCTCTSERRPRMPPRLPPSLKES